MDRYTPCLTRFIGRSTVDKAEAFQAWVYEVELPSIRKVGSYSVQAPGPADKKGKNWHSKRLGGKELMKLKNATLQQQDLIKEFTNLKLNLRQRFVSTFMDGVKTKLLTVAEAKKRKADTDTQHRKQQKLLQAEQRRAIECAA
ncbi:TPA: hypothetical protein ACH3X3_005750 [Trebouxia sp. C0006]